MKDVQIVRSGPNEYICHTYAADMLEEKLEGFRHPVVVSGEKSLHAFQKVSSLPASWPVLHYDGTASNENIQSLSFQAQEADIIIGIGGGKVLDTAKGLADLLHIEVALVPTVAGTCAAYTPISAIYNGHKEFSHVAYYRQSPYLTLVDLRILIDAPAAYLLGGIGDTLAKWYESEAITRQITDIPITATLGVGAAKIILGVLLNDSEQALEDMRNHSITPAFRRVVETIIAIAGTVGGFGDEYGRMAGAHAIHNGLSYIEETHTVSHGLKVAYGILVQLVATGDVDEVLNLLPLYKKLGFPFNFSSLGIKNVSETEIQQVAAFAAKPEETFKLIGTFTADDIKQAMYQLEEVTSQSAALQ